MKFWLYLKYPGSTEWSFHRNDKEAGIITTNGMRFFAIFLFGLAFQFSVSRIGLIEKSK